MPERRVGNKKNAHMPVSTGNSIVQPSVYKQSDTFFLSFQLWPKNASIAPTVNQFRCML